MPPTPLIPPRPPPRIARRAFSWRGPRARALVYQLLAVGIVGAIVLLLTSSTLANMRLRGIQSGFDFLLQPAGFAIGEGWLRYESTDPYWMAFLAGLVNTLRVALPALFITTILGTLLGIGRFSANALVRGACYGYVELLRNVPLLLQLLMWYLALTEFLPAYDDAWRVALGASGAGENASALEVSKNGISFPLPWSDAGGNLSPEYLAVFMGLTLYTAAFIAEVVRAGIASVPAGQMEATAALGLPRSRALRLVVMPQAMRLIVPPLANQYLNLTKNSSLAVAVGYPDVVSIANTSLNQSGRAVECIVILMGVYLTLSLLTSLAMNRFNRAVAIRER